MFDISQFIKDKAKACFVRYPVFISGDDGFIQDLLLCADIHMVISDLMSGNDVFTHEWK